MIPRYQLIAFRILFGGSLLMALLLVRGCVVTHQRLIAQRDLSPIPAPTDIPNETVSVALANDADGSITLDQEQMALPPSGPLRASALLEQTMAHYALPSTLHPLPSGRAISDVYFVQLPLGNPASTDKPVRNAETSHGQMAVIDLKGTFASAHPSGIEAEDLTLRSLIGTLHANFPEIDRVQFLVDGRSSETLAGHADLLHPYPALDTTREPLHTLGRAGRRE